METTKRFYMRTHKDITWADAVVQVGEEEIQHEIDLEMADLNK